MYTTTEKILYWLVALAAVTTLIASTVGCADPPERDIVPVNLVLESSMGLDECPLSPGEVGTVVPLTLDLTEGSILELKAEADAGKTDWTCRGTESSVECFTQVQDDAGLLTIRVDLVKEQGVLTWADTCAFYYRVEVR